MHEKRKETPQESLTYGERKAFAGLFSLLTGAGLFFAGSGANDRLLVMLERKDAEKQPEVMQKFVEHYTKRKTRTDDILIGWGAGMTAAGAWGMRKYLRGQNIKLSDYKNDLRAATCAGGVLLAGIGGGNYLYNVIDDVRQTSRVAEAVSWGNTKTRDEAMSKIIDRVYDNGANELKAIECALVGSGLILLSGRKPQRAAARG